MAEVKYLDKTGLTSVWSKVKGIVTPKADKVSGATAGHLAGLNSSGNLMDSGLPASNIAQKDGSYSGMTVGAAEDLVSAESVASEFTSRITGGSTSVGKGGTALLDKIKGRTLVWNQLVKNGNFETTSYWTPKTGITFTVDNNTATVTSSAAGDYYVGQDTPFVVGHKYMFSCDYKAGYTYGNVVFCYYGSGNDYFTIQTITSGVWQHAVRFFTCAATTYNLVRMQCGVANATNYYRNIQIFDLTLMYGSGNEPSTAAEFEALYPGPYYDYNQGTLISNSATAIETVGWNIWDEEWENGSWTLDGTKYSRNDAIRCKNLIKVFPNTGYYISRFVSYLVFFDSAGNVLASSTAIQNKQAGAFTTPSGANYAVFYIDGLTTYNNDTCISLSDPSRNGTYEPYWRSELELGLGDIKVKSHNLWDEEWSTDGSSRVIPSNNISVSPSTTYYFKISSYTATLDYLDANGATISSAYNVGNSTFTTPANCAFLRFTVAAGYGSTYKNDICINLSDPAFNGHYEPYGDGGVISLTGGLKSAGEVYDEISGGKLVKRIESVDMGTLDWTYGSAAQRFVSAGLVGKIKSPDVNSAGNAINTRFQSVSYSNLGLDRGVCVIFTGSNAVGQLWLYDSAYTDAATFKAAMSGVPLYYELATPIEYELADAIPTAMRNDPYGTERRLPEDTAAIVTAPFRADITYSTNIKEAVQSLPQNYININSMQDFLAALGALMGGTWTMRPADGKFDFTFTPNPSNE